MRTTSTARKTAKKSAYHHGDLRAALLEAAIKRVAKEGTAAISLRELAQDVGVTHAAPYRHFRDKDSLFAAVAEEGFVLLRSALIAERDAAGPDTTARLRATGVGYVKFAVKHPGYFKVMFSHVGKAPPDVPNVGLAGGNAFQVLVDAIISAQLAGTMRAGDPMKHALTCWSAVHGLASLLIEHCLSPMGVTTTPQALAQGVVDDLLLGLHK